MPTLLIRMAAPLQAWGVDSKFETRRTGREPSKSGIVGFLAAAMGYRRDEDDKIAELSRLNIGIRVDKEGTLLRDYHTVHGAKSAYVTNRYYLSDAIFLVGVESNDGELIERLANALEHPVFPLFLGRRSCPPTLPICLGTDSLWTRTKPAERPLLFRICRFRLTPSTENSVTGLFVSMGKLIRNPPKKSRRLFMTLLQNWGENLCI